MHLFDIDVPGRIKFTESDILSPGNELVTFQSGDSIIGLVCVFCIVVVGGFEWSV